MGRVSGSTKPPPRIVGHAGHASAPGHAGDVGAPGRASRGGVAGAASGVGTAVGVGRRAPPKILAPRASMEGVAHTALGPAVIDDADAQLDELVDAMACEVVLRHANGRRVLDLGHGAPRVTEQVAARAASHVVVDAVDLGRGASVTLPLHDAAFDLVYCLRTLPHLGHDAESSEQAARSLLLEVARLLAPGGVALMWIDNPLSLWGALHGLRRPARALERGPLVIDSARGLTRFDTLPRLLRMLPPVLSMTHLHGLRVVTLLPHVLAIPLVGRILTRIEWWARDRAIVRRLGAHLLVELRRSSSLGIGPGVEPRIQMDRSADDDAEGEQDAGPAFS